MESANFETITPGKAENWLNSVYENQRPLRMYHVNFLANEMTRGRFSPTVTIFFCIFNGKSHLVNGQHTLSAIKESGVSQSLVVARKSVATNQELSEMYFRYDINKKRTLQDAIISLDLPKIYNTTNTAVERTCRATTWIYYGFISKYDFPAKYRDNLSHQDRIDLALPWMDYSDRIMNNTIAPCESISRNNIAKSSILSVALITMKYRPEDAMKFWKQVAQNDGLKIGDPRRTLHEWMRSHHDIGSIKRTLSNPNGYVHPNSFSIAASKAWNKFILGDECRKIFKGNTENENGKISLVGIKDSDIEKYIGKLPSDSQDNNINGSMKFSQTVV